MKINKEKLQKLLVSHWTEVIPVQELMSYIHTVYEKDQIKNIQITRFELINQKFVIWVEFYYNNNSILFEFITDSNYNLLLKSIVK